MSKMRLSPAYFSHHIAKQKFIIHAIKNRNYLFPSIKKYKNRIFHLLSNFGQAMLQIAVELVAAIDVNDDGMCVN